MEAFARSARGFIPAFSNTIEEPVRQHLTKVYGCLTLTSFMAAVGVYVNLYTDLASAGLLSFLGGLGCLFAIHATEHNSKTINTRLGFLAGFGFLTGVGMGPLIEMAIHLNPSILLTALTCSVFLFASFSLSAVYAKRGYYLFLAGPLGTLITTLLGLSIANLFFGTRLLFQVNLYLGLLAMSGFILYDTTLIMEKRRFGNTDFIGHSVDLFIHFIGIFKRILIILMDKEANERRRRRKE